MIIVCQPEGVSVRREVLRMSDVIESGNVPRFARGVVPDKAFVHLGAYV